MQIILLTGMPRCGSSWACRVFAAATQSVLINEPFNWETYPDRARHFLKYVPAGEDDTGLCDILRDEIARRRPLRRLFRRPRRFLIKDVHAFLATERIAETLRPRVIVLMRHPCAVAQSWAKLHYGIDDRSERMLRQPALMRDYLAPFEDHICRQDNYFSLLGAYWGSIYYILTRQAQRHSGWQIVTHEDLCADPEKSYAGILAAMGFSFRTEGRVFLQEHDKEQGHENNAYAIDRPTRRERDKWKSLLSPEHAAQVLAGVEPFGVFQRHYPVS